MTETTNPTDSLDDPVQQLIAAHDFAAALPLAIDQFTDTLREYGSAHDATASAANTCGLIHLQMGDFGEAWSAYQSALSYLPASGAEQTRAMILYNLAELDCLRRDGRHADSLLDQVDALLTSTGEIPPLFQAGIASVRALAAELRGEHDLAERLLLVGMAIARRDAPGIAATLVKQLAALYDTNGNANMARALRDSLPP